MQPLELPVTLNGRYYNAVRDSETTVFTQEKIAAEKAEISDIYAPLRAGITSEVGG